MINDSSTTAYKTYERISLDLTNFKFFNIAFIALREKTSDNCNNIYK